MNQVHVPTAPSVGLLLDRVLSYRGASLIRNIAPLGHYA